VLVRSFCLASCLAASHGRSKRLALMKQKSKREIQTGGGQTGQEEGRFLPSIPFYEQSWIDRRPVVVYHIT